MLYTNLTTAGSNCRHLPLSSPLELCLKIISLGKGKEVSTFFSMNTPSL